MSSFLYWSARLLLGLIQVLPLVWVARAGRGAGMLVYLLDARHRRVARRNLALAFPRKSRQEIRALARENFRRIGENFACAARTFSMGDEELQGHVTCHAPTITALASEPERRALVAIGHFGNFELYARLGHFVPGYRCGTTFRGLRQPGLNRLLQSLRRRSGCEFFDRRYDVKALKEFMRQPNAMLGLLADQHAGDGGLELPFFGHVCSTSAAPALLALRYDCRLFTGYCFRVGLGQWRLESVEEIPTHEAGRPRSLEDLMIEVNRSLEKAILRDPANWFWVHNRWKLKWKREGRPRGTPGFVQRDAETLPAHG